MSRGSLVRRARSVPEQSRDLDPGNAAEMESASASRSSGSERITASPSVHVMTLADAMELTACSAACLPMPAGTSNEV